MRKPRCTTGSSWPSRLRQHQRLRRPPRAHGSRSSRELPAKWTACGRISRRCTRLAPGGWWRATGACVTAFAGAERRAISSVAAQRVAVPMTSSPIRSYRGTSHPWVISRAESAYSKARPRRESLDRRSGPRSLPRRRTPRRCPAPSRSARALGSELLVGCLARLPEVDGTPALGHLVRDPRLEAKARNLFERVRRTRPADSAVAR